MMKCLFFVLVTLYVTNASDNICDFPKRFSAILFFKSSQFYDMKIDLENALGSFKLRGEHQEDILIFIDYRTQLLYTFTKDGCTYGPDELTVLVPTYIGKDAKFIESVEINNEIVSSYKQYAPGNIATVTGVNKNCEPRFLYAYTDEKVIVGDVYFSFKLETDGLSLNATGCKEK